MIKKSSVFYMLPKFSKMIPVLEIISATLSSAEKLLSAMRRLKTYLRHTLSQDRLNHIAQVTLRVHMPKVCVCDGQ